MPVTAENSVSPPYPTIAKKKRAYYSKVSTGCKTCKIRHLKCGEELPHCRRCTSTGRRCDGYSTTSSSFYSSSSSSYSRLSPENPLDCIVSQALTAPIFANAQESRSFFFFREYTIPQVSNAFDSEVYNRLLLQACSHNLAVRHAACALGALHESFDFGDNGMAVLSLKDNVEEFAMQQYLKAIGYLLEPMRYGKTQAADIALMTCILFTFFEILRGNQSAAISHIDGGAKIISELHSSSLSTYLSMSRTPYIPLPALNKIFMSLDFQAATVIVQRGRRLNSLNGSSNLADSQQSIPVVFESIENARKYLDYIRAVGASPRPPQPPAIPVDPVKKNKIFVKLELLKVVTATYLRQWDSALNAFVERNAGNLDEATRKAILILRAHRMVTSAGFKIDSLRALADETAWDILTAEYEAILELATEYVGATSHHHRVSASFSFETGILFPLYFVAVKCRDYWMRRQAIELMRRGERVEGILNSLLTARVAERLMMIEEEGLCEDVTGGGPERVKREDRVSGVQIQFEGNEKKANLKYQRFVKVDKSEGVESRPVVVVEEWIEW